MRRPATTTSDLTLAARHGAVLVDASAGAVTITLPKAAEQLAREYTVKKIDASTNAVTVARSGSDLIDGSATLTLSAQYDSVTVKSDTDTAWLVLARSGGSGGGAWTLVKKPTDQSTNNDTTLSSDNDLTVALPAGKYHIRGKVMVTATDLTQGYKYGFNFTGTLATAFWHRRHTALGTAAGTDAESTAQDRGSLPASIAVP